MVHEISENQDVTLKRRVYLTLLLSCGVARLDYRSWVREGGGGQC